MISNPEEMGFQTAAQLHEYRGLFPHGRVLRPASSQANRAVTFTSDETPC